MICKTYETGSLGTYKYVVVLSEYQGHILLSRHKNRTTWETQGGHIEAGETPLEAAKRELYEESGAVEFTLREVCDYWAGNETLKQGAGGMVFHAKITRLSGLPESEMAEVRTFEHLPENLTYPDITPVLFGRLRKPKRLLYGTGNPAKLAAMRRCLQELDVEILGLNDIDAPLPKIVESGKSPLENARIKALAYYDALRMPVFSCDSGLYIENLPQELQPGVHVRTIKGKYLTDEEMMDYYSGLARKYGDLRARYLNAFCLVLDRAHIHEAMNERMGGREFIITSKPHVMRKKGFPIDSLSIDPKTGKYFYDQEDGQLDQLAVEDGFVEFFRNVLGSGKAR